MEVIKMKFLAATEIHKLSFPDCKVEEMSLDPINRELIIKTDSGFLSINEGITLKSCVLIIKNWQSIKASLYRAKTKKWENLDFNTNEKLSDICEFEYGNEII